MQLRADHVAGTGFIVFGLLIFALSGDLPTGQLSMPGSGFLPKICAGLMILGGGVLALRGQESGPFADVDWTDGKHALMVIGITAAATVLYTETGFVITMIAMMMGFLLIIERKNVLHAALYCIVTVGITYVSFVYGLKLQMPTGPLGF
ncbi:MAG TPA: tripartite tricarboxylate transporter TctB family protein [Pseudolabrys sp.]|nr:tripartite tricarboxylate transporter TctB family protein [Pseudolabrys sp.]